MYNTQTTPTIKFQGQFGTCLCSVHVPVHLWDRFLQVATNIHTDIPVAMGTLLCKYSTMNLQFKKDFIKLGLPYTQHWLESNLP